MHNTSKRALTLLAFVTAFIAGVVILAVSLVLHGNEWATHNANGHIYTGGNVISAGMVYDADNNILAKTEDGVRVYNEDATIRTATLHAVGDTEGSISTGVHSIFEPELTGYNIVNGVYYLKQKGEGNDVTLTLKSDVCATAYEALEGRKGTVGVYNYLEGNIVCMVSAPSYDPENKPDAETMESEAYNGAYINRFLSSTYTPGSTFKAITAACALMNIPDIYSRNFDCEGSYDVEGADTDVICNGIHGHINFEEALNCSCNVAFSQIAIELGKNKLQETVDSLGFTSSFEVDRIKLEKGTFDLSDSVDIDIGWAGIGQYTTKLNPCMMMTFMGAIANDATAVRPYFVKSIVNSSGEETYSASRKTVSDMKMSPALATALKDLLRSNVENYYGDYCFPGLTMCGKTGTAEVGDDETEDNALFVGFSADKSFPYAVVVIVENSGSTGYETAVPIANEVLQALR